MAKPNSLLPYYYCSLCCFFLVACASVSRQQSEFKECQLDSIHALEPDNRIESEAGLTETWNADHPELRCAGVAVLKRTINPNGLHLPSYVAYPELHFVQQGKGVLGMAIPGCAETYEEPQLQHQKQPQQQDRHQKVRYVRQGDVIAIPPGVPYWSYNYGNSRLVIITLQHTTNIQNQLDPFPRRFYLAGKPETEHPAETRSGRKHVEEEEGGNSNNMFSGFDREFLARVLKVREGVIRKLQSPPDGHRDQIIEVKGGLSIIRPPLEREIESEEAEAECRRRRETPRKPRHEHGREEKEVEEEPGTRKRREWRRERRHGEGGEEEEEEEVVEEKETKRKECHHGGRRRESRGGEKCSNAMEETVCTLKLHENIADPSRADIFNPSVGRISTVNSLTLPVLKWLQLSAQWVKLYKDGIYVPHWNMDANSVMYVTSGRGRVHVVNSEGESVFNGEVRRGQLLVVPQNFAVAKEAGSEGLEYVAFKTKDRAKISTLVGRDSAISATPAEVLEHAFGLTSMEVNALKNNRNEGVLATPDSQPRHDDA